MKLTGSILTMEEVRRILRTYYLLSCSHDLVCDEDSKCACYKNIEVYIYNTLLEILGSNRLMDLRYDAGKKFGKACKICNPQSCNPRGAFESLCWQIVYKIVYGSTEVDYGSALSFLLDVILSSDPRVISFYKRGSIPVLPCDLCLGKFGVNQTYEFTKKGVLDETLNVSGTLNNRMSAFLTKTFIGSRREKRIRLIVETRLKDSYSYNGIRCHHDNYAIGCKRMVWGEPCHIRTRDRLSDNIKILMGRLIHMEQSDTPCKSFKKGFCMQCSCGKFPEKPKSEECHKNLIRASYSLPSLVEFLLDYSLMNMKTYTLSNMATDAIRKTIAAPWLLSCKGDDAVIPIANRTFIGAGSAQPQKPKPKPVAIMLYGKTRRAHEANHSG